MTPPELHGIPDGGWCPNSPRRPLLIYRAVAEGAPAEELSRWFEATFAANGWPPAWRDTIFGDPHFHSTSHEVIGIFCGQAEVRFGDSVGFTAHLEVGDAVVIPAGVSHQRLWSTDDFQGVGAYPEGFPVDVQRPEDGDRAEARRRVAGLPIPPCDPLFGENGPLRANWRPALPFPPEAAGNFLTGGR